MLFRKKIKSTTEKSFRISLLRLFLCIAISTFSITHLSTASHAQTRTDEEIPNEFIFSVIMMPDWTISDAIFAYELNGKYYLPIKALSDGFEFFSEIDIDGQLAKGFASTEDKNYTIDGKRGELTASGQRESLSQDAILISDYVEEDDLYVQLEVLNQLWPVNMYIDLSNITIQVEAEEDLAFIRKKEREEKQIKANIRAEKYEKSRELLPFQKNEYLYLGKPIIDYQAIYNYDTEDDDLLGSNIFTGVQQIGRLIANYSANFRLEEDGQINRPDSIRLNFSREAHGDEYLLIPTVKRFEAGDVTIRQRELITSTRTGRGITISNDNKDRDSEFDRITIEGFGPPGWETELYNNDELIEFSTVPDDGKYVFEDIVLGYGNNEIKILFFGPQGQVREETQSYNAGGSMRSPGEFIYKAGFLDADRDFILLDNEPRTEPRGLVKTGTVAYGLNKNVTLFGGYTEVPENTEDKSYVTVGAAMATPIGLVETEAYQESGGGNAISVDYITKFLGFRSNLVVSFFNDFESQEAGFGTNKKSFETEAQINRNIGVFGVPIGLRLNALHTEREVSESDSTITFAQTYSRSGIRLSHSTTTRLVDANHEQTNGSITSTVREGNWQFRGGLNYNAYPDLELTSGNGEIRYKMDNSLQLAYNLAHNFLTSDYSTGVQVGYDFKKFLGTFETDYERNNGWMFTMRATTSLNPYNKNGAYDFSSMSRRNQAPVKAQIFLDKNADGLFDEDIDEPLPETKLNIGGARSKTQTDENGYIIANAPPGKQVNITIDERSLIDPYYVPAHQGFSTNPIKGKMIEASFPVVETGSIEGTVYRTDTGKAVSGLKVNLTNLAGEAVMSTVTGFDGFYAFEFVAPNTYVVIADLSHNVKTMMNTAELTPDELFIYGHDLYIVVPSSETQASNSLTYDHLDLDPLDPLSDEEMDIILSDTEEMQAAPQEEYGPAAPDQMLE